MDKSYVEILLERAGTMAALDNKEWQRQLAAAGAGENSKTASKTIPIKDDAEYIRQVSLIPRALAANVAGVVHYWNGHEIALYTAAGGANGKTRVQLDYPGFLTTLIIFKDEQRKDVAAFRDMAATAPVRKIIVAAIRTLRSNADQLEAQVNKGEMENLQTLCKALRDSVNAIEVQAKALA